MLSNALDIEESSVRAACASDGGGAVHINLAAAFSSIARGFLAAVSESLVQLALVAPGLHCRSLPGDI
eukprot:31957-Pyramimonas_sp.AAC.1